MKLNPADRLPPVNCPLLVKVNGQLIRAERNTHIETRDREMTYTTQSGEIVGRFEWTYP